MSGIKSNELQKLPNILGTDTILVDAASAGTARVPFDKAAEFFHKALQEKGLSADNIFLADGETSLSTALSNKADAKSPLFFDFPFSEGFQAYQSCYYTKDQFESVNIIIGSADPIEALTANQPYIVGFMPEGYRPRGQIYGVGGVGAFNPIQTFTNSNGVIQICPTFNVPAGHKIYLQFSYTAAF